MPEGERFWNPYRWVEVSDQPVQHETPAYLHQFSGMSGRIACDLENLTPLIIGDGHGNFVRHTLDNNPYIPATSLKGVIRSLAELVGNTAVPFPKSKIDPPHASHKASVRSENATKLDIVARTFGHLGPDSVMAGLIRFSDAVLSEGTKPKTEQFTVPVGRPKPSHEPFYPDNKRRKIYHHHPGTDRLVAPHAGITQTRTVHPVLPGLHFSFRIDFTNLRDEELNLLLYCLVLEEKVTVKLNPAAVGPEADGQVTITGPLAHKIGGCKPQGAGSVLIRVTRMQLCSDSASRYRGKNQTRLFEGVDLSRELSQRTAYFSRRTDKTMQQLRAMLIYTSDDPRANKINYPRYDWFEEDRDVQPHEKKTLKPTL